MIRRSPLALVLALTVPGPLLADEVQERVLGDPESVAAGAKTFSQNCVYCHGHEGIGGKARPLQGRDFEPGYLFKTISQGRRRGALVMPPWRRSLSEEQRWQLAAYILSLSQKE